MIKKCLSLLLALGLTFSSAFADSVLINGAGATFPYPIYSKWFDLYQSIDTSVRFNYQSIGSGGGIKQISAQTVDFGATDGPMTSEEMKAAEGGQILHIPMVLGAVTVAYNIEGVKKGLKLTPDVLADIFLGKIQKWNDERITALNPDFQLPQIPIVVVHRSDGSGTTSIWVDYLSKVSKELEQKVGRGTSVNWPVGLGGKGNEGVAGQVKNMPGGLGYVELAYAIKNNLPAAAIQNRAGQFIEPTLESTSAAAVAATKNMPPDFRVSLTDQSAEGTYPVVGFTYLLIYKEQRDEAKGRALVKFLGWAIRDGQKYGPDLLYAPLPAAVVTLVETKIREITYNGAALLAVR